MGARGVQPAQVEELVKRTRKWAFVAQEATRLAELGLPSSDIARRLGVNSSTVRRWVSSGRLARPTVVAAVAQVRQSPEEWARDVRATYDLDATDDQLVVMAETALRRALDPLQPASVQLSAMGRFQAIVKQLALVARKAAEAAPEEPKAKPQARPMRRPGADPRNLLQAVK
jgi:hypothetical protein